MAEMKIVEVVDIENGIFKVELPSREDAEKLCIMMREDFPYAIINGTGYYSDIYILNLFKQWGDLVTTIEDEDGPCTCLNCEKDCTHTDSKPWRLSPPGLVSDRHRCSTETFWAEVVQERYRHFIDDNGHVYAITSAENGGFCGTVYDIFFADGETLERIGLWHRGKAPECVKHFFRKGRRECSGR